MDPSLDALRRALRDLPNERPPATLWPAITAALDQRAPASSRRRERTPYFLLAAAVMLGVLTVAQIRHESAPVVGPTPITERDVDRLAAQSSDRQSQLQAMRRRVSSYSDVQALLERDLENALGLVDLQLSRAADPADAIPLWRNRIRLLDSLIEIAQLPASKPSPAVASAATGSLPEAQTELIGEM